MRRLGLALKIQDFKNDIANNITTWFEEATTRFNLIHKAGPPVVGEVPQDQWGIFKDTTTNEVSLVVNDAGSLKTVGFTGSVAPFYAYRSAVQSVPPSTLTKVQFNAELFDTSGVYSTTTYRFQPNVAGYYLITAQVSFAVGSVTSTILTEITKNGFQYADFSVISQVGSTPIVGGSTTMYLNGTTDFVEVYAFQNTGVTVNLAAGSHNTAFQGHLIQ